jgi:hypothetical protein
MACFQTKSPDLGKFLGACNGRCFNVHLVYFMAGWYILWPFGIFYGYLVYLTRFGMLHHEKSGNPG